MDEENYTLVYYRDLKMHTVFLSDRESPLYTNLSRAKNDKRKLEEKYTHLNFYIAKVKLLRL